MADWVSLRDFARRRGVSLTAVQKAIASGRVTAVRRNDAGRLTAIDADLAAEQWNERTDPELALRTGTVVPPPNEIPKRETGATGVDEAPAGGQAPADAGGQLPVGAESRSPRVPPHGGDDDEASPDRGAESDNFHRDRAENERIKRINGELDLAERLKRLGKVEEFRRAGLEAAMQTQDALMRLPERLAPLLAAETDPVRCHALLAREIRVVLDGLAERARQLAAA